MISSHSVSLTQVRLKDDFGGPCYLFNETNECYYKREENVLMQDCYLPREDWDSFDPTLTSEAIFAIANIFR